MTQSHIENTLCKQGNYRRSYQKKKSEIGKIRNFFWIKFMQHNKIVFFTSTK
jgi:hypothetical protein